MVPAMSPCAVPGSFVLTNGSLLSSLAFDRSAAVVGDTLVARVTVRNSGSLDVLGLSAGVIESSGDGAVAFLGTIEPASLDLPAGAAAEFVIRCLATSPGSVALSTNASGTEFASGVMRRSLRTMGPPVALYARASDLRLFPVESRPFTVSRGQRQVVPLRWRSRTRWSQRLRHPRARPAGCASRTVPAPGSRRSAC